MPVVVALGADTRCASQSRGAQNASPGYPAKLQAKVVRSSDPRTRGPRLGLADIMDATISGGV